MMDGFAERLKQLRKQRDLSQAELARRVELHQNQIGRFERGESRPSADTLKRLADALAVTGDYLLEGVTDEAAKARFEDRELLEQFQEVQKLPDEDKALVKSFLGAFLFKEKVQGLSARKVYSPKARGSISPECCQASHQSLADARVLLIRQTMA